MARAFALLFSVLLAMWVAPAGIARADDGRPQVNPEEEAAAMIRPAVVYLAGLGSGLVRLPGGQVLSEFGRGSNMPFLATWGCTGFVVNPDGWVATAGHCVDPQNATAQILKRAANEYITEFPDAPESRYPATALEWLQKNGRVEGENTAGGPDVGLTLVYGTGKNVVAKMSANVVDFRPLGKGDVALLRVEKHNLPSSELAPDSDVSVGTSVLAVGFPQTTESITGPSLDPTNKSGKVSKKTTMGSVAEYEIDAAVTEGMSGGPTVELNGKVIGVNSFAPVGEPQAFNFIAPADGLAALMAGKGVKPMLGPADRTYRSGLAHYFQGHYSDAVDDFDQTLAMSPDYPGLVDLKAHAVNLREQFGDASALSGSNLLWYTVVSVALVLVVGAGATFMALKAGKGPIGPHAQPLRLVPAKQPAPDEPHFCANCGAQHHPAERFCPDCGKHILIGEPAGNTSEIR
ncbi:trypsin-like peptidase domain-containing protein [Mycobacterium shigaense]|uniref:trypsin-like peptidase domain-containing protein n=1 Tax=Mycobacterium shigaense TaxID=722731 RepID=UPI001E5263AD|nr:trypsin-like peptidase domain-containing protein [Mycobacterium shigaense]MEA1124934.1 trypsin-like peptidase domain-containing protein [Mycobacterium shigaense]